MAAFVQSRSTWPTTSASSTALAYNGAVGSGSLLVAAVGWNDAAVTCTVADSVNGAWTALGSPQTGAGGLTTFRLQLFYRANTAVGTPTVTATFSGPVTRRGIGIHEYSGMEIVNPVDGAAVYTNDNSTTPTSSPITTTFPVDLLFCACIMIGSETGTGAGYTLRESANFGVNGTEDQVVTSVGTYDGSFSASGGDNILGFVAFKAASDDEFAVPLSVVFASQVASQRARRRGSGGALAPQDIPVAPAVLVPLRVVLTAAPRVLRRPISGLRRPLATTSPPAALVPITTILAAGSRRPRRITRYHVGSPKVVGTPVDPAPTSRIQSWFIWKRRSRRPGAVVLGPPREIAVSPTMYLTMQPNIVALGSRTERVRRLPYSMIGAPVVVDSSPSPVQPARLYWPLPRERRQLGTKLVRPRIVLTPSQFQARPVTIRFPRRARRILPRSKLRPPTVIGAFVPPRPATRQPCATGPLPYLKFGDVEIANVARTVEYLRNGLGSARGPWELSDCGVCPVLYTLDSDDCTPATFVSPAADPAPWYDATQPGASTFLGITLLDMSGYDSTVTREVSPRTQGLGGAAFSGQRRNPRTWKFRAALVSADDVGAEYGLKWLTKALQASSCSTCDTGNLTVRLVCPPENCTDDTLGQWMSYDVVLTEGPTEVEKYAPGGGQDALYGCRDLVIVEWTMVAGNPLLYKPPVQCLSPEILGETVECTDICDFLFGAPGEAHCCTVAPPARGTLGAIFTIQSVSGMNGVLLGAYANCPTGSEDNPVLEMELSHIPAGGTVVVNSARRTITITTPDADGGLVTADGQSLLVLDERALEWIEARNCDDITCFCARTAHPCSLGGDTLVTIETQLREG